MADQFHFKDIFSLLKAAFKEWQNDDPFYLSAVVAYYTLFALPGLLVLLINIVGPVWAENEVKGEISSQISEVLGQETAQQVEVIMNNALSGSDSTMATLFSIATLIFGATGVFFMLQKSLNKVWDVKVNPESGILRMLKSRAIGLGMIVVIGFLLLVFLLVSAFLSILTDWIRENLPDFMFYGIYVINFLISLLIITLLFAVIYKVLPDVEIGWKSLWVGSLVTAFLFVVGKFLMGLYFGNANPIGQQLQVGGRSDDRGYEVTGVMQNIPSNTHFTFDFFISLETLRGWGQLSDNAWRAANFYTYLVLKQGASPDEPMVLPDLL